MRLVEPQVLELSLNSRVLQDEPDIVHVVLTRLRLAGEPGVIHKYEVYGTS